MGAWGYKLYEDDVACDVRDYYKDCLRELKESDLSETKTLAYFEDELNDSYDSSIVWFALAETEWQLGRLSEKVRENALEHINSGNNLEIWREAGEKLAEKREKVLLNLKETIQSPMPSMKKLRKSHVFICSWNIGDVFAYQLKSNEANEKGFFGKWLVVQNVNQADNLRKGLSPVVTVRLIDSTEFPTMDALKEPCIRIDHYLGYKWSYRLHILAYSKKQLNDFVFIGNSPLVLAADDYPHENNKGYTTTMLKFFEIKIFRRIEELGTEPI